jgi:hypothetical protein
MLLFCMTGCRRTVAIMVLRRNRFVLLGGRAMRYGSSGMGRYVRLVVVTGGIQAGRSMIVRRSAVFAIGRLM